MELILAIAALCHVNYGGNTYLENERFDRQQLECQQYYLRCYEKLRTNSTGDKWMYTATPHAHHVHDLATCVKERKI
jgi:hypothetical protein